MWFKCLLSVDSDHNSRGEASTVHHNDNGNYSSSTHHSFRRDDLPTPAALAEILQLTRQLLAEHVEERLLVCSRPFLILHAFFFVQLNFGICSTC